MDAAERLQCMYSVQSSQGGHQRTLCKWVKLNCSTAINIHSRSRDRVSFQQQQFQPPVASRSPSSQPALSLVRRSNSLTGLNKLDLTRAHSFSRSQRRRQAASFPCFHPPSHGITFFRISSPHLIYFERKKPATPWPFGEGTRANCGFPVTSPYEPCLASSLKLIASLLTVA